MSTLPPHSDDIEPLAGGGWISGPMIGGPDQRELVWRAGDPQPAGVTVVYTRAVRPQNPEDKLREWRLTDRGWYCHTEWGHQPDSDVAYCEWDDLVGGVFAPVYSRPA